MKFGPFEIPDDVAALFIFAHLSKKERLQARLVSRDFRKGLQHYSLWKKQFIAYGEREREVLTFFGENKVAFADIYMKAARLGLNKLVEKRWVSVLLLENEELIRRFFEDSSKGTNWLDDKTYSLFYSYAPLHICAMLGNSSLIDYFSGKGMSLEAKSRKDAATPLLYAARSGQTETMKKLVALGANTGATDKAGKNIADYAQESKKTDSMAYIESLNITSSTASSSSARPV